MTATLIVKFEKELPTGTVTYARFIHEQHGMLINLCNGTNTVEREFLPYEDFPEMRELFNGTGWDDRAIKNFLDFYGCQYDGSLEVTEAGEWMNDTYDYALLKKYANESDIELSLKSHFIEFTDDDGRPFRLTPLAYGWKTEVPVDARMM